MSDSLPRLFADERGVWREDRQGSLFGIEWAEITGVCGYKLDGITEIYTVVELDHPSGHWIELHADWPGFTQVVDSITAALPWISPSWFEEINVLPVEGNEKESQVKFFCHPIERSPCKMNTSGR